MTVRLGIVGVGDVALRDYLPELGRLEGRAEVTAVCARSEERARAAADLYAVPRWTLDFAELAAAPDVDAVLNLTPFALHLDVTMAALRGGKHVYSEKPLALDAAAARLIATEASARGLIVVPAPSVLLFPQLRRARELVDLGVLGPIHTARAHMFGGVPPWSGYISDPTPFFSAVGGPLVDMGVYALHAVTGLLGRARRVSAASSRTRDAFVVGDGAFVGQRVPVEVDDNWHVTLELASGAIASVLANNCAADPIGPELELHGERGTLGLSLLDVSAPLLLRIDGETTSEAVPHERESGPDHLLGVEHLVDCIERRGEQILTVEHAVHVIEVMDAAKRSAREHCAVSIDEGGGSDV